MSHNNHFIISNSQPQLLRPHNFHLSNILNPNLIQYLLLGFTHNNQKFIRQHCINRLISIMVHVCRNYYNCVIQIFSRMELQQIYCLTLLHIVFCEVLLSTDEHSRRTRTSCVWTILEKQSCLLDSLWKFTYALKNTRKRFSHQSCKSYCHSLEKTRSSTLLNILLRMSIKSSYCNLETSVQGKSSWFSPLP